jgi:dihydroorotase
MSSESLGESLSESLRERSSELLQQVRLIDPTQNCDRTTDILIVDGVIKAIDIISDVPEQTQVKNAAGLILGTGLVDLYSHSGEPGFESRETLDSLLAGAIAGGFTRLTLLPDTEPAIDNPSTLGWFNNQLKLRPQPQPQLHYWSALTLGTKGEQMADLAEMAELTTAGLVGFSDSRPLASAALLRRSLEYAQSLGLPIALYCSDRQLTGAGVVRDGVEAMRLGLPGIPDLAETAAIAMALECIAAYRTAVHLMRVSTARSLALIGAAKARGLPITASTTWMHILRDITAVYSYDPSLHLDPPLGNTSDRLALIEALKTGVLDAIAIDHRPFSYEEKTVPFAESPPGAIGLELALPLLWQSLVESGELTALELWRSLSLNPARCLQQKPASLTVGSAAEAILFDPRQCWQITAGTLRSRSNNTPWLGQEVCGRVVRVWADC